jgi:excinuclease ABC subunit C
MDIDSETFRLILPESPGVYLFKDQSGNVIYVGKAKNLKKRLLSYFRSSGMTRNIPVSGSISKNPILGSALPAR